MSCLFLFFVNVGMCKNICLTLCVKKVNISCNNFVSIISIGPPVACSYELNCFWNCRYFPETASARAVFCFFFHYFFDAYKTKFSWKINGGIASNWMPPKPEWPVCERNKNKNCFSENSGEKLLSITKFFIAFLTKISTVCSVIFLLHSGIAPWSNKKVVPGMSPIFSQVGCYLPELVPLVKKRDLKVRSWTNCLYDLLNTTHYRSFEKISNFF